MTDVLVTGSNKGIGLATVLALSRAGHKVYATMRDLSKAAELREVVTREGLPVEIHALDVDSDASVAVAIGKILAKGGTIGVLINNAGGGYLGSAEELPMETFRAVMETNFFGTLRCIRAVLPGMRGRKSGCIINVSSVAGRVAMAPFAAYATSKFALEALSEILAQEVKACNIRVAIVEPGLIDTAAPRRAALPPRSLSLYPHARRYSKYFRATLGVMPPLKVGEAIRDMSKTVVGNFAIRCSPSGCSIGGPA